VYKYFSFKIKKSILLILFMIQPKITIYIEKKLIILMALPKTKHKKKSKYNQNKPIKYI